MRKVTVSPLADDIGMQLLNPLHQPEIPALTEGCIFHKWTTKLHAHPENNDFFQEQDYALIEFPDGVMRYVRPEQIRFESDEN